MKLFCLLLSYIGPFLLVQDASCNIQQRILPLGRFNLRPFAECGNQVKQREGWIYSPNYPSNYDDSLVCIYTIHRYNHNVCKVEIKFNDFDLEDTRPDCESDFLDVGQGNKLCGTLMANTKIALPFPRDRPWIRLKFKSDSRRNRKGFMALVSQVPNSCELNGPSPPRQEIAPSWNISSDLHNCSTMIDDYYGTISSPQFPSKYLPNQKCVYGIHRIASHVCRIELSVRSFEVDYNNFRVTNQCTGDFLELPDKTKLCGFRKEERTLNFPPSSDYIFLNFKSDEMGSSPGFNIDVRQVPYSCDPQTPKAYKCDHVIRNKVSRLRSTRYPDKYGSNEQCVYTIEKAGNNMCRFEMDFVHLDLESSRDEKGNCNKDFLQLPDGSRICGDVSGRKIFTFPQVPGGKSIMYFSSDSYQEGMGFDIVIRQIPCRIWQEAAWQPVPHMPMMPVQPQPPHSYPAQPHPAQSYPTQPHPSQYYPPQPQPAQTYSTHPHPAELYPSQPQPTQPQPNQRLSSNQSPAYCNKVITNQLDVITSPKFPKDYPNFSRCSYVIHRASPDICEVELLFLAFDLEMTSNCRADYLFVEQTDEKLCGQKTAFENKTLMFPKHSDNLRLSFVSDGQVNRPGFEIRIEQVKNSCNKRSLEPEPTTNKTCATSSEMMTVFRSDNYPSPYDHNIDCNYRLIKGNESVCKADVYFSDFIVGTMSHEYCYNDYLEINDVRYCGYRRGEKLTLNFKPGQEHIDFRFKTDQEINFGGFRIDIKQSTERCEEQLMPNSASMAYCDNQVYNQPEFQIVLLSYPNNLDCNYVVTKSSYDVCALEVRYNMFDLESSEECVNDYLQIGEEVKLCGKLPRESTRTYEFGEKEMMIKFHSNPSETGVGLFLTLKQIKC